MSAPRGNTRDERAGHYAGIISRSASFVLDAVVFTVGALGTVFVVHAVAALMQGEPVNLDNTDSLLPEVVFLGGSFVYFAGAWWVFGRTVGEAVFGLRVVRGNGRRITVARAVVRFVFMTLGLSLLGLGYLWMLIDKRRRTWGDIVAGTVMVYDSGSDMAVIAELDAAER